METANTSRKIMPAVSPHVYATSAAAAMVVLLPTSVNFAIAMASGVSGWLFVHPADVVKVSVGGVLLPLSCTGICPLDVLSIEPSPSEDTFLPFLHSIRSECSSRAKLVEAWCRRRKTL
jgi:hypothetical protein